MITIIFCTVKTNWALISLDIEENSLLRAWLKEGESLLCKWEIYVLYPVDISKNMKSNFKGGRLLYFWVSHDLGKSVIVVLSSWPKALTQVAPSSLDTTWSQVQIPLRLICLHFSLLSYFPYQAQALYLLCNTKT